MIDGVFETVSSAPSRKDDRSYRGFRYRNRPSPRTHEDAAEGPTRFQRVDVPLIRKPTLWGYVLSERGEKDRALSATGWAEIETLAGERAKVVMAPLGVGAAYPRDALEIVTTQ